MASQNWLGERIRSVSCFQSLLDDFLVSHNVLTEIFSAKKIKFSFTFLLYLKFSALSVHRSFEYQLNLRTDEATCTTVGSVTSFDSDRSFRVNLMPKTVKNWFPLPLSIFPKTFTSSCTNNESKLGFVTPIRLPGEAVDSFSRCTRS